MTDTLVRLQIQVPSVCLPLIRPVIPMFLEMYHPDVHHLSMPLLNKRYQLYFS